MIGLLCGVAAAVEVQLDVLGELPAHTPAVTADSVPPLGGTAAPSVVRPDRTPLDAGVLFEVVLGPMDHQHHPLVSVGGRVTRSVFEHQDFTFDPVVVESRVDLGGLSWFGYRKAPSIDGYATYGGGVQVTTLSEAPWPTTMAPAAHTLVGLGLGSRTGPVSWRVEGRLSATVRFDNYIGRAQLAEDALEWRFWPGSASAALLVGVGWRSVGSP